MHNTGAITKLSVLFREQKFWSQPVLIVLVVRENQTFCPECLSLLLSQCSQHILITFYHYFQTTPLCLCAWARECCASIWTTLILIGRTASVSGASFVTFTQSPFFPGCSTNLPTLEGFVWKKQVKIYLHIIAVWPVGVLDVATLSRQLSAGLLMKAHKHRKCNRERGNLRVLQAKICLIPRWFFPPCLNFAQCGLERSCLMWAWDFPRQMINQPRGEIDSAVLT